MNHIQIPITVNGKTALATAGKYCAVNIDINVSVSVPAYDRYDTFANALGDGAKSDSGIFGGYTDEDGLRHVVFLDDYQSSTSIPVQTNCVIHLNGHTIEFTAAAAQLNINTAESVVIDGNVTGSKIKKSITSKITSTTRLMYVDKTALTLNGGEYSLIVSGGSSSSSASAVLLSTVASSAGVVLGEIVMNGCLVALESNASGNTKCIQTDAPAIIKNCKFSSKATSGADGKTALCFQNFAGDALIENCEMASRAYAPKMISYTLALGGDGTSTVNNCDLLADGACDVDGTYYGAACISVQKNSHVTVNDGHYKAAREAIALIGTGTTSIRINGGVFEGCQHGGAYLGGDAKVKNATFRNIPYFGDCGWNDTHFGVCYCGSGNRPTSDIYFDNCKFEAADPVQNGVVVKYTNTSVYLSNTVCDNTFYNLRVDEGNTIYIGQNVDLGRIYPPQDNNGQGHGTVDTTTYAGQSFAW